MTGPPATGPRTASSDVPSTGKLTTLHLSGNYKNWAVEFVRHDAHDLCTRSGALLVPKGYRVSERLVAGLANFNQGLLPTVIRMRKTVT